MVNKNFCINCGQFKEHSSKTRDTFCNPCEAIKIWLEFVNPGNEIPAPDEFNRYLIADLLR